MRDRGVSMRVDRWFKIWAAVGLILGASGCGGEQPVPRPPDGAVAAQPAPAPPAAGTEFQYSPTAPAAPVPSAQTAPAVGQPQAVVPAAGSPAPGFSTPAGTPGGDGTRGLDDTQVYATTSGSMYHKETCYHLRKSRERISLREAKSRGLQPCSDCGGVELPATPVPERESVPEQQPPPAPDPDVVPPSHAMGLDTPPSAPAPTGRSGRVPPFPDLSGLEPVDGGHFCGATNKNGSSCRRWVKGPGRCWQHQ